jgi:hypothetical protein
MSGDHHQEKVGNGMPVFPFKVAVRIDERQELTNELGRVL